MVDVLANKPTFSEVVGRCYEAAWDQSAWPSALSVLNDHVGSQAITLESYGPDFKTINDFHAVGIDTESIDNYINYYHALNPRHAVITRSMQGDVIFDQKVLSEKEMDHSEFYADLLRPYGLRYFLASTLIRNENQLVVLAEHICSRRGHSTQAGIEKIQLLAPYFAHAYQLSLKIGVLKESYETNLRILDSLDTGIVLLDNRAQLFFSNRSAEKLCLTHHAISLTSTGVWIRDAILRQQFNQALMHSRDAIFQPSSQSLLIPGDATTAFLRIDISPLRARGHMADEFEVSVKRHKTLVLIRDVGSQQSLPDEVLKYCFSITQREIELARGLVDGQTLSQYADYAEVKITTVRSQFASLRSKLGAHNQADVMRILIPLLRN